MEKKLRLLLNVSDTIGAFMKFRRGFCLTKSLRHNPNNVTEIRIPVPWGHVAGKWWGDTNEQPILALHGWQDNAGTFDPLLELLPDSKPVLVIDSPGHGFSSHFPEGFVYNNANYLMVCRRIHKFFKWDKKMTLLGHSEGGIIAFIFAAIYPEFVNALITLDVIKPFASGKSHIPKLGKLLDESISKSRRNITHNPKYSLDEIEHRWLAGTKGSLTVDAVKILMKRGVRLDHVSGKYSLTRDPKLKLHSLHGFDESQSLEMARNLKCHYLVIKFSEAKFFDYSLKKSPTFISTVTESAKSFKLVTTEGTHHAHLNNPERVAPVINEFIENTTS